MTDRNARACVADPDFSVSDGDVQRLEAERLHPTPPDLIPLDELFRQVLDLISAECRRAGMLPARHA